MTITERWGRGLCAGAVGLLCGSFGWAVDESRFELFNGYSWLRSETRLTPPPIGSAQAPSIAESVSLHGWSGSFAGALNPRLSVAAEVDGHYGSADLSWSVRHGQEIGSVTYTGSAASESRAYSFLLGPRLYLAERGGLRPFAQVLLGAVRWTVKTAGEYNVAGSWIARGTFTDDASGVGFATAIGGGADIRLSQRISLRVIQVDYHMARLGLKHRYSVVQEPSGDSASKVVEDPTEPLHNLRLTFGLVFRMAK